MGIFLNKYKTLTMKKKIVLIGIVLIGVLNYGLKAQAVYQMGLHRIVYNACGAIITDNGGLGDDYGNYRNDTITIFSGMPATPMVMLTVEEMDIESGDSLFIYNAGDANPAMLFQMGSLGAGFLNNSNAIILGDFSVNATIQNPSGAVTLVFKTNGTIRTSGFKIIVSCIAPCQRIIAEIDTVLTYPQPHRLSIDDGFKYIDLCELDTINLVAKATFIDNSSAYQQSYDSCSYIWNIGNSTYTIFGNPHFSTNLVSGNGYNVTLQIKDQKNCINTNSSNIRVQTSTNPIRNISSLNDICEGTTISLQVDTNINSSVYVSPLIINQLSNLLYDSAIFIPDGPCNGIPCYNTSLYLNTFLPGSTITNSSDILSLCFTMEHSFLGDLKMSIKCPNGSAVATHIWSNGAGLFLGLPLGLSNHDSFDGGQTQICDPQYNLPGTGWNYCWSENPAYSYHGADTSNHYINNYQVNTPIGSMVTCDSTTKVSSTYPMGANYYKPHNSFSGLIGCPLNGAWSFEICDLLGRDNGYIFQWQLNINLDFLNTPWSYSINIDSVYWSGEGVVNLTNQTAQITPTSSGLHNYSFTVIDSFGCQYDSTTTLNVLATPTNQSSNFYTSLVTDTTMNIGFTRGDGDSVLIIAKSGSAVDAEPSIDNYISNSVFGLGSQLGNGNYVVYKGTGNIFNLSGLTTGTTYHFAFFEYNSTGTCYKNPPLTANATTANVGITENASNTFNIKVFPNPFTNKTTIEYTLTETQNVELSVVDITGKELIKLKNEKQNKGKQIVDIDASKISNGIYFYKLKVGDKQQVGKLIKF